MGSPSVVSEATADEESVASESGAVAFDTTTWRKLLAFAAGAELPTGFESIFAWNALPEAGFSKKAPIDGHRFSHSNRVPDSAHRKPRPECFSSSRSLESAMRLASSTRKRLPRQRLRPSRPAFTNAFHFIWPYNALPADLIWIPSVLSANRK